MPGKLKYIIHTQVGEGPKQLFEHDDHLLNNTGLPKKSSLIKNLWQYANTLYISFLNNLENLL